MSVKIDTLFVAAMLEFGEKIDTDPRVQRPRRDGTRPVTKKKDNRKCQALTLPQQNVHTCNSRKSGGYFTFGRDK